MSKVMGNDGSVLVGSDVLAEVSKFTVNESAVVASDVACGDTWAESASGSKKWSGSIECFYEFGDTAQVALTPGAGVTLKLYPEEAVAPNQEITGSVIIENVTLADVTKDAFITCSFSFIGNGAMTKVAKA